MPPFFITIPAMLFTRRPPFRGTTKIQILGQAAVTATLLYLTYTFPLSRPLQNALLDSYISASGINLTFAAIRENKNKMALLGFAFFALGAFRISCSLHEHPYLRPLS